MYYRNGTPIDGQVAKIFPGSAHLVCDLVRHRAPRHRVSGGAVAALELDAAQNVTVDRPNNVKHYDRAQPR